MKNIQMIRELLRRIEAEEVVVEEINHRAGIRDVTDEDVDAARKWKFTGEETYTIYLRRVI